MTPRKEIKSWARAHIASANYVCDHCGHEIYATQEYYRKVWREDRRESWKRFLVVERVHGSCPEWASGSHKRY